MSDRQLPVGVFRTRIEWIDTDAAGIYHNSTVTRFVEAAEAALMRERGLGGYFASAPRARYEVDYLSPLFFGQEATTVVTLASIGRSSMTWTFEVWGEEFDGRLRSRAARGRFVTVHVGDSHMASRNGTDQRHSTPWPATWVQALTAPPD